jgi:hypothetical protein
MARGKPSEVGDKTVNQNGYEQTKTADRGWVATHVLVMEESLGRKLEPGEYISFKPGADKVPVLLGNLELRRRGDKRSSNRARIAQIEARMEELQAELDHLRAEEGANA